MIKREVRQVGRIVALSKLSHEYPKARLALCGLGPAGKNLAKRAFAAAERRPASLEMVTLDDRLANAARKEGFVLLDVAEVE